MLEINMPKNERGKNGSNNFTGKFYFNFFNQKMFILAVE